MSKRIRLTLGDAQVDALRIALPEYIADFNPMGPGLDAEDRRLLGALDRVVNQLEGQLRREANRG